MRHLSVGGALDRPGVPDGCRPLEALAKSHVDGESELRAGLVDGGERVAAIAATKAGTAAYPLTGSCPGPKTLK